MNQNIQYKGLSLATDDINSPNGTLAISANAELHNGALRPSVVEGTKVTNPLKDHSPSGAPVVKLIYVHQTNTYKHFIAINEVNCKLLWFYDDGDYAQDNVFFTATKKDANWEVKIESIGNTLIILDSQGIHYCLWKNDDYSYIGQKPPFVRLSFGLDGVYPAKYDRSTVNHNPTGEQYYHAWRDTGIDTEDAVVANTKINFKNDNGQHARITEAVWALINQAHNLIASEGHFYAPFIVRYCYRLYDGTSILHSAPIFMPVAMPHPFKVYFENAVSTNNTPSLHVIDDQITVHDDDSGDEFTISAVTARYTPRNMALAYRLENDPDYQILQDDWKDIVKSIDIFVSPQFTRADETKIIETASAEETSPGLCDYGLQGAIPNGNYLEQIISNRVIQENNWKCNIVFDIPEISDEAYLDRIQNNTSFFKVCSFNLDEQLSTHFVDVPIDKSAIAAITAQQKMTDDYKTHNLLLPAYDDNKKMVTGLYTYNHRLNAFALQEKLFEGFNFAGMLVPIHASYSYNFGTIEIDDVYIEIETEEGKKIVRNNNGSETFNVWALCHSLLFYPDSRATKMIINYKNNGQRHIELPMRACPALNGAMATSLWEKNSISYQTGYYSASIDDVVPMQNKLYTSEVNNPFIFPPNGINTIGTGAILGIAATTRALSQGQFGKYPLMVFATDGIWTMDVSSSGTYAAVHPLSREVCSNPASICQLDQSVIFTTVRGMSLVSEQNLFGITDELFGHCPNINTIAPELTKFFRATVGANLPPQTITENGYKTIIRSLIAFNQPPIDYMQTARVIYDFANSRLLVIGNSNASELPNKQPIYVYSIADKTWSTMLIDETIATVNAYPHPYLQDTDGYVSCIDRRYPFNASQNVPTLIVTRALTFGDAMYAINEFAHNQLSTTNNQQPTPNTTMLIFGSNNLANWHYIGRTNQPHSYHLPGHSFRFFRIALYSVLKPSEKYISTSINIVEKYPKQ